MHAGFSLVESGFCRRKNAVMVLLKNVGVVALASLLFYLLGFGLMFGGGNAFIGASQFRAGPRRRGRGRSRQPAPVRLSLLSARLRRDVGDDRQRRGRGAGAARDVLRVHRRRLRRHLPDRRPLGVGRRLALGARLPRLRRQHRGARRRRRDGARGRPRGRTAHRQVRKDGTPGRSRRTTSRSPRSACSCSGSGGSASTAGAARGARRAIASSSWSRTSPRPPASSRLSYT